MVFKQYFSYIVLCLRETDFGFNTLHYLVTVKCLLYMHPVKHVITEAPTYTTWRMRPSGTKSPHTEIRQTLR